MEGQRKGRTTPSNLREQVDEKTMQFGESTTMDWPETPTTITGKTSSSNGIEDTNNSSRRSNGRGDQSQPTTDGTMTTRC